MKKDDNSSVEFPSSLGSFLFIIAIGLFFFWLAKKIYHGVISLVGLATLGLKWFFVLIAATIALSLIYSLLELAVKAIWRWRRKTKAMAACPLPTLPGLLGRPRSGVELFFVELFTQSYCDKFGFPPQRTMKQQELAMLRSQLNPLKIRANLAHFHQTIVAALYSEVAAGNERLNKWVEQGAAGTRRRRPFWLFMRVLQKLPLVPGWSPAECWTQTTAEELKSSPEKFEAFCEERAFAAMPFIEEVLAERIPLPARYRSRSKPEARALAAAPATASGAKPAPSESMKLLPAATLPVTPAVAAVARPKQPKNADELERRRRDEQARMAALRKQAVETVELIGVRLTTHNDGWELRPASMLEQHKEALLLARPHHPDCSLVDQLDAMVAGYLDLLPKFEEVFAEEMERDPSDFSPWIIEVLAEATRERPLEACTPTFLRGLACRRYLTTQPESMKPTTSKVSSVDPIQSDGSFAADDDVPHALDDDVVVVATKTLRVPYSGPGNAPLELGF